MPVGDQATHVASGLLVDYLCYHFNLQWPLLVPVVEPLCSGWWTLLGEAVEAEASLKEMGPWGRAVF